MSVEHTYFETKSTFIRLANRVPGLLFEPVTPNYKSSVGIVLMHSDDDYFSFPPGAELSKRGYLVLAANVTQSNKPLDEKLPDVKSAVDYLRQYPGVEKVILLGHSGGATLMSAYQNVAENGIKTFQGVEKIIKCSNRVGDLPAADAVMLLDSNYGNGAMTLLSLDPSIIDETNGLNLNPELDLFNPANGYNPEGSTYNDKFVKNFLKAQGARGNRLIKKAQERLILIEDGKGNFEDDEPFIIPGATQYAPNNKLFPQDIRFLAHTHNEWPLLHKDGSITNQIVPCVRPARAGRQMTHSHNAGTLVTTVRTFLSSSAVKTTADFGYNEDSMYGIEWTSSYCCTPGNVTGISVPILIMGMTGSYEYLASEIIYNNAKSKDKTVVFVEGADHNFMPEKTTEKSPGEYGDTVKVVFDYVDKWICEREYFKI